MARQEPLAAARLEMFIQRPPHRMRCPHRRFAGASPDPGGFSATMFLVLSLFDGTTGLSEEYSGNNGRCPFFDAGLGNFVLKDTYSLLLCAPLTDASQCSFSIDSPSVSQFFFFRFFAFDSL